MKQQLKKYVELALLERDRIINAADALRAKPFDQPTLDAWNTTCQVDPAVDAAFTAAKNVVLHLPTVMEELKAARAAQWNLIGNHDASWAMAMEEHAPLFNTLRETVNGMSADVPPEPQSKPAQVQLQPELNAKSILLGWPEILEVIGRLDTDSEMIGRMNKETGGPIITAKGAKPRVSQRELIIWWNGLVDKTTSDAEAKQSADATVSSIQTVNFGRSGQSVPEIGGGVKPRRVVKNRKP